METPRGLPWVGIVGVLVMIGAGLAALVFLHWAPTQPPPESFAVPYASTEPGTFDHAPFDRICRTYVDDFGLVDYKALKSGRADLDAFLVRVQAISPHTNIAVFTTEAEALAYWINAYNAWMMRAVLDNYPVESVNDIGADPGVFDSRGRICGGEDLSLNEIEHEIVRKEFLEPRAHFALNCASMGCPWLPSEAFVPDRLDEQLEREARRFFAVSSHLSVDAEARTVRLSAILDWYGEDFIRWLRVTKKIDEPSLLDYAKLYAPEELADQIGDDFEIAFQEYDWHLNDHNAEWAVLRIGD